MHFFRPLAAALVALAAVAAAAGAQVRATTTADGNAIWLALANDGFLGTNWTSRAPSLRYRADAAHHYEHLPRGGLWIGANATDAGGAFTGVTTACLDASVGMAPATATEYTPGSAWTVRSSIPSSPYYSPDAVSEYDLVADYDDRTPRTSAGNPEVHRPLGITVRQESYQWAGASLADVVFLRYVVKADAPLTGVWVGLYTEFVSVDETAQPVWPPTGAYHKSWLEYDATYRLLREHYCAAQPVPAGCQLATVPYWVGAQLLTPPDAGQHVTTAGWLYAPASLLRDTDAERYAIMSAGTLQDWSAPDVSPTTGDPVELVAIGPFASLAPGDSIVVDFAFLGGAEVADIQRQAGIAQQVRDLGFRDVPTPALASLVEASATAEGVSLAWHVASGQAVTVERSSGGGAWVPLGTEHLDGAGTLRYVDRDVVPGGRYGYRLVIAGVASAVAWVDVPARAALAIAAVRAGATGVHVEFALPDATPAELALVDVAGRTLARLAVGGAAGRGTAELPAPGASGIYWLRLAQGGREVTTRVVSVR